MSKIAIKSSSSGTATFTIKSPATNTDRTFNLPDSAGTVATAESTLAQFNVTGSAPVFACRAWVNFNGTNTTVRASGNVSSVSKTATGNFTINFATAFPDSNYAAGCSATIGGSDNANRSCAIGPINTTSAFLNSWTNDTGSFADVAQTHAVIFR